jgi:GH25 family lysozyme M1 (1,4-beta-N-acetylmuramidase)
MKNTLWAVFVGMAAAVLSSCAAPVGDSDGDLIDTESAEAAEPIKASPPFLGDPANGAVFAVDLSVWEGPMAQREMDCFWESGVRHVVAGTQLEEVARQQLSMAVSRGMTVDAYVYLYWSQDMAAQVQEAFKRVAGFPIGRMWLDVEEAAGDLGANALIERVQAALDSCRAHGSVDCGIYTGPGFWKGSMNNTPKLSDAPLWYAWYNYKTSLNEWPTEHFGGWTKPAGKQWAEQVLCSVGVDKDTMQVVTSPSVVVDRSDPPDTCQVPPAPTNLYPYDGSVVKLDYLKLMSATIPRATQYQLALESWDGKAFKPYYTWTTADAFLKVSPAYKNSIYRFRARAKNAYGWGAWSPYATFDFGTYKGTRPGGSQTDPGAGGSGGSGGTAGAGGSGGAGIGGTAGTGGSGGSSTPPADGAPTGLSPDGTTVSTSSVTLACNEVPSAARYEFSIEFLGGGAAYQPYVTYSPTQAHQTFWPQVHATTYRWKVRAQVGGTWQAWSADASFLYK